MSTSAYGFATPPNRELHEIINTFDAVRRRLVGEFVDRDRAVRLLQLALVCREHVLLLGPPGTAKTSLAVAFSRQTGTVPFRALLSRFTEPAELFGPLDALAYQSGGRYRVITGGMLAEARIAVLDEVFQGSTAILNALLALIGDRTFHNGSQTVATPLMSLIGTSNELPADPGLTAFADRFLVRVRVAPVAERHLDRLLDLGGERDAERTGAALDALQPGAAAPPATGQPVPGPFTPQDVNVLSRERAEVDDRPVRPAYTGLIRDLLQQGVTLSDRRIVQGLKLVTAAALLDGRREARPGDLWPVEYIWAEPGEDEAVVAEAVRALVDADGGGPERRRRSPQGILREAREIVQQLDATVPAREADLRYALGRLTRLQTELGDADSGVQAELNKLIGRVANRNAA